MSLGDGGTPLAPELTPGAILAKLQDRFPDKIRRGGLPGKTPHAVVDRGHLLPVMAYLKEDPSLKFDVLADVTAVDHLLLEVPEIPERYAVVYLLNSLGCGHRFEVKTPVPEDDPRAPSLQGLWRSALWGERETHDMFGIRFDGNPDLRRLLMPENYPGFPLRKDYPLKGRGERDSFHQYRVEGAPGGQGAAARMGERGARPAV